MAGFLDSLVERAQGGAASMRPLAAAVYGDAFEPPELDQERVADAAPAPPAKQPPAQPAPARADAGPEEPPAVEPEDLREDAGPTAAPASPREPRPPRPPRRSSAPDAPQESPGEEGAARPAPEPRSRGIQRRRPPRRGRTARGRETGAEREAGPSEPGSAQGEPGEEREARPSEPRSAQGESEGRDAALTLRRRAPEPAPLAIAPPAMPRGAGTEPAREETVTVSIGRVEVRATPSPAPVAASPAGPRQSLDDWLADYERGTGG